MSKINELNKLFIDTKTPDEIIMAIFSKAGEKYLPKDPTVIHKAIFRLKQEPNYEDVLKEFSFDISGLYPFSDLLDRVLFRLESSCILGTLNPKYERYEMPIQLLKNVYNDFPEKEKKKFNEMGKKFKSLINSHAVV